MNKMINYTITPVWAVIDHIRKKIQTDLSVSMTQNVVDAATICAIELVENAVKYGESVPNMQYIQFELDFADGTIEISVSNGVTKKEDIDCVTNTIDRINNSGNVEQLYIERLTVLMEQTQRGKSQLGLFRIANETGFKLAYSFDQNALTISASRRVP